VWCCRETNQCVLAIVQTLFENLWDVDEHHYAPLSATTRDFQVLSRATATTATSFNTQTGQTASSTTKAAAAAAAVATDSDDFDELPSSNQLIDDEDLYDTPRQQDTKQYHAASPMHQSAIPLSQTSEYLISLESMTNDNASVGSSQQTCSQYSQASIDSASPQSQLPSRKRKRFDLSLLSQASSSPPASGVPLSLDSASIDDGDSQMDELMPPGKRARIETSPIKSEATDRLSLLIKREPPSNHTGRLQSLMHSKQQQALHPSNSNDLEGRVTIRPKATAPPKRYVSTKDEQLEDIIDDDNNNDDDDDDDDVGGVSLESVIEISSSNGSARMQEHFITDAYDATPHQEALPENEIDANFSFDDISRQWAAGGIVTSIDGSNTAGQRGRHFVLDMTDSKAEDELRRVFNKSDFNRMQVVCANDANMPSVSDSSNMLIARLLTVGRLANSISDSFWHVSMTICSSSTSTLPTRSTTLRLCKRLPRSIHRSCSGMQAIA
jgi:hypothetical protein